MANGACARSVFGTTEVTGRELTVQMDTERRYGTPNPPPQVMTIAGVAQDTDTTHFMLRRGSTI